MRVAVLGLAFTAAGCLAAWGQGGANDACVNQISGAYDPVLSADWQARFARADQPALQRIAGVWYAEVPNPQLGMVAYQYHSFQPNQIFDYQSQTCGGGIGSCSQSAGTGMYAAESQPDGSVFVTTNVSDNNRSNACSGTYVRFLDSMTMQNEGGTVFRRVQ
jgi:hypothetical protein